MNFLRRKPALPAALKPALAPEERVLAWSLVTDDRAVVATNHGLWLPGSGSTSSRLGWHEIHKAAWSGRELRITPAEQAEERDGYTVLVDGPIQTFLLLEPGQLPDQVRTRVTKSVAYTTHHPLPSGSGGVRVVGRRVPGQNGLSWAVRYDSGTPVTLPAVIELTDELVATARSTMAAPD
ncbi:hypothetical protein Aab01nite_37240 [Paractinoplanes abujensis]|uniref:Uncharacterized protein n=1 Tax=Paractinoplanes abujensis TaxID=882441 RepID=A0A7W7CU17_9ACTN|nr:hypothetical protein [Actinoplanes abujensis]MBB4694652.1 hypothetical protein [Actinoplanes abujensis]GID20134.1 hypothetical protein Aab01nite_37240 [Actinoplanes abujensis]